MAASAPPSAEARQAIQQLAEAHGRTLYALGLKICGSPEQAADMVQETFLDALRGWHGFEGRSQATTWLYTIAKRVCFRMHRRRAGEPTELDPLEALLPGPDDTVADPDALDPFAHQVRREVEATVDRALAELPLDFRIPLVLIDLAELSIAETAAVLDLPVNTVKTRVHRARLKLRQAIDRSLPQKPLPRTQPAQVCLAMLKAKQLALDREVPFPFPEAELCERCKSVFGTLELGQEVCRAIGRGELPPEVAAQLEAALTEPG